MIVRGSEESHRSLPAFPNIAMAQDSATVVQPPRGATSTAARAGPPDTSNYMHLGYAAAIAIFAAYIGLLFKRVANVRKMR